MNGTYCTSDAILQVQHDSSNMSLCELHHVAGLAVEGPQVADQLVRVVADHDLLLVFRQVVKAQQPAQSKF